MLNRSNRSKRKIDNLYNINTNISTPIISTKSTTKKHVLSVEINNNLNFNNVPNYNFLNRKNFNKTYELLTHHLRVIKINSFFIKFIILVYKKDNKIYKVFKYPFKYKEVIEEKIENEIFYQRKIKTLESTCDVKIPEIYYTDKKNVNNNTFVLYIICMEYINFPSIFTLRKKRIINTELCSVIQKKINKINLCLIENGINHNDLTTNNILVDINDLTIYIIDFGETFNSNKHEGFKTHNNKLCNN